MVLRLYLFKRCFFWIFILYHWAQRKRLHPLIHLYITRQSRLPYGAIHCLLHHCLLVLLVFYMMTRLPFGGYSMHEAATIVIRFYTCFILFCIPGLLITALPLNFQTANTVFSISSFIMLALGIAQTALPEPIYFSTELLNPLNLGKSIMQQGIQSRWILIISIFMTFIIAMLLACKHLRINPVWSRY